MRRESPFRDNPVGATRRETPPSGMATAPPRDRPSLPLSRDAASAPAGPAHSRRRPSDDRAAANANATRWPFSRSGCYAGTGTHEDQNGQFRHYMEDASVVAPNWNGPDLFVAVYDGHGGRQAVDYASSKLHDVMLGEQGSYEQQLTKAFHKVDDTLRLFGCEHCGSTATVAVLSGHMLTMGHVGDSRATAVHIDGSATRLTPEHKASCPKEQERIRRAGGSVHRGRVGGQLLVSRALGDHGLKSSGVIATPELLRRDVQADAACIIASDGLWDTVNDQQAAAVVVQSAQAALASGQTANSAADDAARKLVDLAKQKGSGDNITVLVLIY